MWTWLLSEDLHFNLRSRIPSLRRRPYAEHPRRALASPSIPREFALNLSDRSRLTNEFYLWALHHVKLDGVPRDGTHEVLDLGSRDFSYAPALSLYLGQYFLRFEVLGLELDPFRMFTNLYRRGDLASYYVDLVNRLGPPEARFDYRQGDWLEESPKPYDLITCFFPFLYEDLHRRFGLPRRTFDPRRTYEKIFASAKRAIFFHQGKEELQDSIALVRELRRGKIESSNLVVPPPQFKRKHPLGILVWAPESEPENRPENEPDRAKLL